MNRKLVLEALAKVAAGILLLLLLVFLPAGDWGWTEGWRLMVILFVPMVCAGVVMMFKNPELLRKRLNAKEARSQQSLVIKLSALMFLAGFLVAGLDHRFSWSRLPGWVSWVATGVFLAAYGLYGQVLRENAFLSRTIEVQTGQKVVDTGLYSLVRHPMYSATLFLFLSMPLVLGSLPAFALFLCYPVIIIRRLLDEETFLRAELPGYTEYTQKVKWRLIPFLF